MAEQIDLNFIARRLDQVGNDMANMRDDIVVLTAMVSRLEASVTSLVQEMRATHSQMARFDNRLRKLESEPDSMTFDRVATCDYASPHMKKYDPAAGSESGRIADLNPQSVLRKK